MKKRINLVVILMAFCTALLLGLQLYWNYQAYQNSVKNFKNETNDALYKTVEELTNIRKDKIVDQYKLWLADTNLIVISCKYNAELKVTVFNIMDRYPLHGEKAGASLSIAAFKGELHAITPEAKTFFIDNFVKGNIYNELNSKTIFYITQRLGEKLDSVFKTDKPDLPELALLYKKELLKRDITTGFSFNYKKYSFKKFNTANEPSGEYSFATRFCFYGFREPLTAISAWFPDPNWCSCSE